ncbi:helix-turn-helix domain-containing protein [Streptomyces griseoaurantiacus]|uniref:helix-turn-helix domain-containing protein n=1 Tax=Streptomyces griseoaurantiacus TaxID=68213 RepID=UPI003678EBA5
MLKRARLAAGVKIEDVKQATGLSVPALYRHEGGYTAIKPELVPVYAKMYQVDDEAEIAKWTKWAQKGKSEGTWATAGGMLGPSYEDYADAETLCEQLRFYEPHVIHGLLQTTEYSRAAIATDAMVHSTNERRQEELLRLRESRKQLLAREDPPPPRIWAILGESAVLTPPSPGDKDAHREQVERLLQLQSPQMTLQILPMDTGLHAGMSGSFSILTFDINVDMVFREGYGDGAFFDEDRQVLDYRVRFESLQSQALSPAASRRYLQKLRRQLAE